MEEEFVYQVKPAKKRTIYAEDLRDEIASLYVHVTGLRAGKGVLNEFMKQYRDSVLRIIDEQPTIEPAPKWISVRERLPEPGQEILAVVGNTAAEPYTITTKFWDATFTTWASITHWMPLPEPPKMYAADMNVGRKKEG